MKNGKVVYHCKRTSLPNAEVETFAKPERYILRPRYLTIQPNTGNVYDSTFGEFKDYTEKGCATPYEFWEDQISEGDRFYLDSIPEGFENNIEPDAGWGFDANYVVNQVAKQNVAIYFGLKSIVEN
jgi:hypothetical protein